MEEKIVEKKEDRRIQKTRTEIKKALVELLISKDISKITVTELTNACNLNRATFYLHYNTVSDVLGDLENEIIEELKKVISSYSIIDFSLDPYPLLKTLSEELPKYKSFAKLLMSTDGGAQLLNKLKTTFKEYVFSNIKKLANFNTHQEEKIDRYLTFLMAGTVDTYQEWFNSDPKTVSLEELCKDISNIISAALPKLVKKI